MDFVWRFSWKAQCLGDFDGLSWEVRLVGGTLGRRVCGRCSGPYTGVAGCGHWRGHVYV